jgi:group I intron endonuclease
MKTGIIYLVTNTVNGKVYVGQTIKPLHSYIRDCMKQALRGSTTKPRLYNAIRKYGRSAFTVCTLESVPVDGLDAAEIKWIRHYESFSDPSKGYNLTVGGGGRRGYVVSDNTRQKISVAQRGCKSHMWGKTHSPEWKEQMSAFHTGRPKSEAQRRKQSLRQLGQHSTMSTEARARLAERSRGNTYCLGKKRTLESRQRMSESRKGRKQSAETVAKRLATQAANRLRRAEVTT